VDERGLVLPGEGPVAFVEELDGVELAAVEGGERRGDPAPRRWIAGGSEVRQVGEVLAGHARGAVAEAQELVGRGEVEPADDRLPAAVLGVGVGLRGPRLPFGRHGHHAALGVDELVDAIAKTSRSKR
jgi:hypothetical protein